MQQSKPVSSPVSSPPPSPRVLSAFTAFFQKQPGTWHSERTYHYTDRRPQERETSDTTFDVSVLSDLELSSLLAPFGVKVSPMAVQAFRVSFLTNMESKEEQVKASVSLAFVVENWSDGMLKGGYYRDQGYEEKGLRAGSFEWSNDELRMTTEYSKVISVDEIKLIQPDVRLRRIVNYGKGENEGKAELVGYGVEIKQD